MRIVLASNNAGKIKELNHILPQSFELLPAKQFELESPEETGTTFVENAIIKARYACQETGLSAIADDSGLEVDALNGAPGVYSSRFAGPESTDQDNNSKLLKDLSETTMRSARFRCVIVFMRTATDPMPIIAMGTWEGEISRQPKGGNGFGYDPIFFLPALGITAADMNKAEKNSVSHRGQAIRSLQTQMATLLAHNN